MRTTWMLGALLTFLTPLWASAITITINNASGQETTSGTTTYYFSLIGTGRTYDGSACPNVVNPNCVNETTSISFTISGGASDGTIKYKGANNTSLQTTNVSYTKGATTTVTITMSTVCSYAFSGGSCNTSGSGTLTMGIVASGGTDFASNDSVTLQLNIDNTITAATDRTGQVGVYGYTVFEGDEKLLMRNISARTNSGDSPAFPLENNGSGIGRARFYYKRNSTSFAALKTEMDAGTASYTDFSISGTSIDDPIIKNLDNDITYVVAVALVDKAGNIGYVDDPTADGTCTGTSTHCGVPGRVLGILKANQGCFIATAAYGSPDEKNVKVLRRFRDEVLLKSERGQKLVRWYYEHSPAWAESIRHSETKKKLVRAALTPAVVFSELSLRLGATNASLLLATLLMLPLLFFRWATTPVPKYNRRKKFLFIFFLMGMSAVEQPAQAAQENLQPWIPSTQQSSKRAPASETKVMSLQTPEETRKAKEYERPKLMQITSEGKYVYKVEPTKQNQAIGVRVGPYAPKNIVSDSGIDYQTVYGSSSAMMVNMEYEYQFLRFAGKLGAKGSVGFFSKKGQGQWEVPANHTRNQPEEVFNLYVIPSSLSAIYRAHFWDKQPIVPFGEVGGDHFTIIEARTDKKSFAENVKTAGANGWHWAAGAAFQLDFLDKAGTWNLDTEYGINHIYLTAQARQIIGLNANLDFSAFIFEGGITVEF